MENNMYQGHDCKLSIAGFLTLDFLKISPVPGLLLTANTGVFFTIKFIVKYSEEGRV